MWAGFYLPHRNAQNPLHNDDCIYTPKVTVFKTDTAEPKLMPEADWYQVNVITCATPNLHMMPSNAMNTGDDMKNVKLSDKELYDYRLKGLAELWMLLWPAVMN